MASFPGAVKTFVTRNAGDTIQPSHVNDLQDEVNAIEAGYLNGTANLNSSNSTLANLSVPGGSTLAGTLQVGGNSTFAGNVTVNGSLLPHVLLTHSAKTDVANASVTGLNWDTETFDGFGMHSTSVNSSRIVFAASTGRYVIGADIEWSQFSTGGVRYVELFVNDAQRIGGVVIDRVTTFNVATLQSLSACVDATSTASYVTLRVYQDSGSTGSISSGANVKPIFWAQRL